MYSTQSGAPRARAGDNYYLTAPRTSVNIHHRHVFQPAKPERTKPAIVSYNGVAFAYLSASGIRRDLPKARQKSGIRPPREARSTTPKVAKAKVAEKRTWVWQSITGSDGQVHRRKAYAREFGAAKVILGTVVHSTKEHL